MVGRYIEVMDGQLADMVQDQAKFLVQTDFSAKTGKNLIVGMATNYTVKELYLFVTSWKRHCPNTDMALIVSNVDEETRQFLLDNGVILDFYWDAAFTYGHFSVSRYFCYYRLLRTLHVQGRRYDDVLLSDTRDVVFQGDPFKNRPQGEILAFLEDAETAIGTCATNARWIYRLFGEQVLEEFKGKRISCSGTTLGSFQGILFYLLMFTRAYLAADKITRINVVGCDQGIHNFIFHRQGVGAINCSPGFFVGVENGVHIMTMHHVKDGSFKIDKKGRVTNAQGKVCPVVHQYERHPKLIDLIQKTYNFIAF